MKQSVDIILTHNQPISTLRYTYIGSCYSQSL